MSYVNKTKIYILSVFTLLTFSVAYGYSNILDSLTYLRSSGDTGHIGYIITEMFDSNAVIKPQYLPAGVAVQNATTTTTGIVMLDNATGSTLTTKAPTINLMTQVWNSLVGMINLRAMTDSPVFTGEPQVAQSPVSNSGVVNKAYVDAQVGLVSAATSNVEIPFPGCGSYSVPASFPTSIPKYSIGVSDGNVCNKTDFDANDSLFYPESMSGTTWYNTAVPLVSAGKYAYTRDGKPIKLITKAKTGDFPTTAAVGGGVLYGYSIMKNKADGKNYMAVFTESFDGTSYYYSYLSMYYYDTSVQSWIFKSKMNYTGGTTNNPVRNISLRFTSSGVAKVSFVQSNAIKLFSLSSPYTSYSDVLPGYYNVGSNNDQYEIDELGNNLFVFGNGNSSQVISYGTGGSTIGVIDSTTNGNSYNNINLIKNPINGKLRLVYSVYSNIQSINIKDWDATTKTWITVATNLSISKGDGYVNGTGYYNILSMKDYYYSGLYDYNVGKSIQAYYDNDGKMYITSSGVKAFGSGYMAKNWIVSFDENTKTFIFDDTYSMTYSAQGNYSRHYFDMFFDINNNMYIGISPRYSGNDFVMKFYFYNKNKKAFDYISALSYSTNFAPGTSAYSKRLGGYYLLPDGKTFDVFNVSESNVYTSVSTFNFSSVNDYESTLSSISNGKCVAYSGNAYNSSTTLSCPSGYNIISNTCSSSTSGYCNIKSPTDFMITSTANVSVLGSINCCK